MGLWVFQDCCLLYLLLDHDSNYLCFSDPLKDLLFLFDLVPISLRSL